MKDASTNILVSIAVALVLASVATYVGGVRLVQGGMGRINTLSEELATAVERERRLDSVKELVNDTTQERSLIASYFVTEDGVASFIQFIEEIAADLDVTPSISSVAAENDTLSFQVSVSGSWEEVTQTLARIESAPRASRIKQLRLYSEADPDAEDVSLATWTAVFTLTTLMNMESSAS